MQRIVQGRSATLSHTFYSDGTASDPSPDSATIQILRVDGTELVASTAATEAGTGKVTYTLTPAQTASLDTLTLRWTASFGGQSQTFVDIVEIAGDVLFRIDQARTALGDNTYDEAKIVEARTYAETELENAVGYALVPRYTREAVSGSGCGLLTLRPFLRAVRSISIGDIALAQSTLDALTFDGGQLAGYWWPSGTGNITVGYEHGLTALPPGASKAALDLAVDYLGGPTDTGIDPRAESIVTVDGTIRLRSSLGQFGAVGVNEWIAANRIPMFA